MQNKFGHDSRDHNTAVRTTGSPLRYRAAQNLTFRPPSLPSGGDIVPSSQSQDDAFDFLPHSEDGVHHPESQYQYSLVPSSQSQENHGFSFPPIPCLSPAGDHSQYEVVPSSQSQERDFVPPKDAIRSRTRTSSDEIVPTSQYDEVELHKPESPRADDDLWLIGMQRSGESTTPRPPREQLMDSPKAISNPRNSNEGSTSCGDTPHDQSHNDGDVLPSSVGARLASQSSSRFVKHVL